MTGFRSVFETSSNPATSSSRPWTQSENAVFVGCVPTTSATASSSVVHSRLVNSRITFGQRHCATTVQPSLPVRQRRRRKSLVAEFRDIQRSFGLHRQDNLTNTARSPASVQLLLSSPLEESSTLPALNTVRVLLVWVQRLPHSAFVAATAWLKGLRHINRLKYGGTLNAKLCTRAELATIIWRTKYFCTSAEPPVYFQASRNIPT